jgi:hypothetical protein
LTQRHTTRRWPLGPTDAWFDVCASAPGLDHALAVIEAVCVELPLAVAACWLAIRLVRVPADGSARR